MISDVPGRNMRPSTMLTCGRSVSPCGVTPRITTLDALPLSRLGRLISTTGSFDRSLLPSSPVAIEGSDSTIEAEARSMPLCTSLCDPRRMISTLSGCPVATRVSSSPAASISTVAKT